MTTTSAKKSRLYLVSLGTCVAVLVVAIVAGIHMFRSGDTAPDSGSATNRGTKSPKPQDPYMQPTSKPSQQEVSSKPAMPLKVQDPTAAMWDEGGNLVCKGRPVAEIIGLDKHPEQSMPLNDDFAIEVAVTEEGLTITSDPFALDNSASSFIVNGDSGGEIPPAYGEKVTPSGIIFLSTAVYAEAYTLTLCG